MESQNTPWEAISAYLKDQSDKQSELVVKEWLKASPDHVRLFNEILNIRQLTGTPVVSYEPQKEELWNELMRRISADSVPKVIVKQFWIRYIAVAAAIAIAFFAGNWFRLQPDEASTSFSTYTQVIAPAGQRTQMILPDSTLVWLNSGSELKYAGSFSGNSREVYIQGECYFEVAENKHKPFIVHAPDIQVKVYGTRFNLKENTKESVVSLFEGKVEVLNQQNESLSFLDPGQQLAAGSDGFQVSKLERADALIAWTKGMLVFENQPFEEVIAYLENWYGVKITLDRSLYKNHNYTFNVKTESMREVLDLISVITPIDYEIRGDQVAIKYKRMN